MFATNDKQGASGGVNSAGVTARLGTSGGKSLVADVLENILDRNFQFAIIKRRGRRDCREKRKFFDRFARAS